MECNYVFYILERRRKRKFGVKMKKIALVTFVRASFSQQYSYFTEINNLKPGDVVVVQSNSNYSVANFVKYSEEAKDLRNAKKWIVAKVDVEEFEDRLLLGDLE